MYTHTRGYYTWPTPNGVIRLIPRLHIYRNNDTGTWCVDTGTGHIEVSNSAAAFSRAQGVHRTRTDW
jgi:hypothetical protein